ncbi:MAG: hypothetical protein Q9Q13_00155 [Acidobacteriota bacterium]|nr:hypothetical protein [Acidobacteriota bacterium]
MSGPLFAANLVAVVLALLAAIASGRSGRRRLHFVIVGLAVTLLAAAVWQAELYGQHLEFEPGRLKLHLALATATLAGLAPVAWTGLAVARERGRRSTHRWWVVVFMTLAACAIASALWMMATAIDMAPVDSTPG